MGRIVFSFQPVDQVVRQAQDERCCRLDSRIAIRGTEVTGMFGLSGRDSDIDEQDESSVEKFV